MIIVLIRAYSSRKWKFYLFRWL